jgi:hypothetical protein
MEVCILAKIVFLLSVIIVSLDIYMFGISTFTMVSNILFTAFLVFITNWSCYNQSKNWVAWIIVIFSVLSLALLMYFIHNQTDNEIKQLIEEEKKSRKLNL